VDHDGDRGRIRSLIGVSAGDPLAPFALRPEKSHVFSGDGRAAIGYRVRFGTAVAGGDPVGERDAWPAAIDEFVRLARSRKLRFAVLGAGEDAVPLWRAHGLKGLSIGRDVVVRPAQFTLRGRAFRNVRQAIQRTRNAGVEVRIQREGDLDQVDVQRLREMLRRSQRDDQRGFSMILGRFFDGSQPDAVIAIACTATGVPTAAHRYLWAGAKDLSLDLPMRAPGTPNGVDERLVAEVVAWGARHGVERISLSFAPFPDLFARRGELGPAGRGAYLAVHLLDPLIKVERLYRYLRKFQAFDQQRQLLLKWRQVVPVALACLVLEFGS
jgi:lysylphosphatidylglycerol synthetase-like protein (DUF2156 family)